MELKKAGMAGAAIMWVAFVAAASTWGVGSGDSWPGPATTVKASLASVPADAIRVNGSQPLVPLRSLRVSGEVLELPDAAGVPAVTVYVGGQAYPALVQGRTYSAELGYPNLEAMVVVEARAPRIQYRSAVGSVQRLRMLAGADGRVEVSEHAAMKVSPFSTALESAVRFALGGRDAVNDAEFAEGVHAGTNAELELTAYVLLNVAHYPEQLPAPYETGYQLLQDRVAYRQFSSYPWVKQYGSGYLFRQDQDGSALRSLSELPQKLVLQDGLPFRDIATRVNRLIMLSRLPDGTYELHTNSSWYRPRFTAQLTDRGVVTLTPIERVWQGFVDNGVAAERSVYSYSLRRMASVAGGVEAWAFNATYRLPPGSFGGFRSADEFSVLAGVSLDVWRDPQGWASISGRVAALPSFCTAATPENPSQHLAPCDHLQHRLAVGGGHTLEEGWRVDPATLEPVAPSRSQAFAWSSDADGALNLTTTGADVRAWRVRTPLVGGGSALGPANVVVLARSRTQATLGQERLELSLATVRQIETITTQRGGDEWQVSGARTERQLYSAQNAIVTRVSRRADGTGTTSYSAAGATLSSHDGFWQALPSAVYDGRSVGYMSDGTARQFRTCSSAIAAGAVACAVQYSAFRPLMAHGGRVYGVTSVYQTPIDFTNGVRTVKPLERSVVQSTYYECLAGNCPSNAVTAASLPPLLLPGQARPQRRVEMPGRAPRLSAADSRIPRLMPIYAFECTQCGHHFDRLQKLSDPDPDTCPSCGQSTVKRQITAPAFRLAGSGWYETDFKKDGDKKRNLADGGEGAKPSAEAKRADSAPAKSESAPAKADAKPSSTPSA